MVESLRRDERVSVVENYNARYMRAEDFSYAPEIAVMDVSFISATHIIPSLSPCLAEGADFILLVKPQFEVGRAHVGKGGIVKDDKARREAVERVIECAEQHLLVKKGIIESPIRGGDGNLEYLAHFKKVTGND
jgi:23S rRNA (cytidine1920-2'-O)/16S rRNA (cytidine1409-2'-O)-methyltransferase